MKKDFVENITKMDEDFSKWYTDVVKKTNLVDYSSVRGCMVIKPYGYRIWELIQSQLDQRFKDTGHQNVYMPMFIPESLLQKEKDHVEGFAPEVAWVTHGGNEKLTERMCVRPTSETLFCEHYANDIESYRDLPRLYNQWCSVVRWEKTTRPFLRSLEFLWQEGHTAHATEEEAQEETIRMLNVYEEFSKNVLAIPMIKGQKTNKEKFAGAKATFTIEALMHDNKALQSGTTHNFSDLFAKAFEITYLDSDNNLKHVHQTSWGVSTRLIGAIIMVHGDDSGLKLPPKVAPIQVGIVPIMMKKDGVVEKASELYDRLKKSFRVDIDLSNKSPGWKYSEYEIKGVPLRLEIGPKDIQKDQCVLVRRDTREKHFIPLDKLEQTVDELLQKIHEDMYNSALAHRDENTFTATDMEEFTEIVEGKGGFIKAMWCGKESCEDEIKEKTRATSRCIPFEQEKLSDKCICCGEKADKLVYWGRAY